MFDVLTSRGEIRPEFAGEVTQRLSRLLRQSAAEEQLQRKARCLRGFGQAFARMRRALKLTRAQIACLGNMPLSEVILIEWGLMEVEEVQALLPALSRASHVDLATLTDTYNSFLYR